MTCQRCGKSGRDTRIRLCPACRKKADELVLMVNQAISQGAPMRESLYVIHNGVEGGRGLDA